MLADFKAIYPSGIWEFQRNLIMITGEFKDFHRISKYVRKFLEDF